MITLPFRVSQPRVLLFGLECQTTRIVLDRLVAQGIDVALVCMPGPPATPLIKAPAGRRSGSFPFVGSPLADRTVTGTAHRHGVDVWRIGDLRSPQVEEALAAVAADALVVACYDRLIPGAIYKRFGFGGLNLHPSLLPDKRGPDPLFWVFHDGDSEAGITVHRLTSRFDAGAILAQRSLAVPDGITEDELDAQLAEIGADLVVERLRRPGLDWPDARPQDDRAATWAPHPGPDDWIIDESWEARRAFNFVRGLGARGHPIMLRHERRELRVVDVAGWHPPCSAPSIEPDFQAITLRDGTLVGRFEPIEPA